MLRSLEAGRYRLVVRPLDENLFVSSVQLPAASAAATNGATATTSPAAVTTPARGTNATQRANVAAPSRDALDIRPGQQLTGVAVRLSEGAAGLSGRVVGAEGSQPPPFANLRVYLLPAERERADDALRYFETATNGDGSFVFKNIPPGRYLLLARIIDAADLAPRPASWDTDSRTRLRREAETANTTVELQPCQRTTDFTLRVPPSPTK
jgi:predicted phage tail protein